MALADQSLYPVTPGPTAGVLVSVIPLAIPMLVLQRFWRAAED